VTTDDRIGNFMLAAAEYNQAAISADSGIDRFKLAESIAIQHSAIGLQLDRLTRYLEQYQRLNQEEQEHILTALRQDFIKEGF
jgi:hypothetical protein